MVSAPLQSTILFHSLRQGNPQFTLRRHCQSLLRGAPFAKVVNNYWANPAAENESKGSSNMVKSPATPNVTDGTKEASGPPTAAWAVASLNSSSIDAAGQSG